MAGRLAHRSGLPFAEPNLQSIFHEPRDVGTGFSCLKKDSLGFGSIKPHLPHTRGLLPLDRVDFPRRP